MTDKDYHQFSKNVRNLAAGMKAQCKSGYLHFDLEISNHFIKSFQHDPKNCE